MSEEATRTFFHRFRNGLTCSMTVSPSAGIIAADWSQRPKMSGRFISEYVAWQRTILETVANESGKAIAQLIQVGPRKFIAIRAEPTEQPKEEYNAEETQK